VDGHAGIGGSRQRSCGLTLQVSLRHSQQRPDVESSSAEISRRDETIPAVVPFTREDQDPPSSLDAEDLFSRLRDTPTGRIHQA
jgi:hypothetical protein